FFIFGFGYASFSDLKDFWDDLPVSRLKYNALEDFQDDLPGSLLTKSSHISLFHNLCKFVYLIFLHLVFNQMVLIFHLDIYFVCSIKSFEHFFISMFFISGADFGRFMGSFLRYNALEDFEEVF
ncbi:hypothetical protein IGI04_027569, partial [Brassica rapa subsp. trilocularis]